MPRHVSLSLDLLHTFIRLVDCGGNASKARHDLHINQASMSKRLRYLQHKSPALKRGPWLVREGKTWQLTDEGKRALPAVRELISRYEQLTTFVEQPDVAWPQVAFGCGRFIVRRTVRLALREFRRIYSGVRLRVLTLRGDARIVGVANGALDLATVAHPIGAIEEIARRQLHVETIAKDRLALVCLRESRWAKDLGDLPKTKTPIEACTKFPLILPEPDAGVRKPLDIAFRRRRISRGLHVEFEVGGWGTVLEYVREGHGVGLVSELALPRPAGRAAKKPGKAARKGAPKKAKETAADELVVRYFDVATVPPTETKIICRRLFDVPGERDLSPEAASFYNLLKDAAR